MVVLILLVLPSVLALNCTRFSNDHRDLCNIVNPLTISENDRRTLMQDNLYGQINTNNNQVNLQLQQSDEPQITLKTIYEEKIVFIGRLLIFILFNYFLFSFITKLDFVRKWLIVDY